MVGPHTCQEIHSEPPLYCPMPPPSLPDFESPLAPFFLHIRLLIVLSVGRPMKYTAVKESLEYPDSVTALARDTDILATARAASSIVNARL